jgi:hypothetical protein
MWSSWAIWLFERAINWLMKRGDARRLIWALQIVNQFLDSSYQDPYPLLSRWARSEQWMLRFYAGRELSRCYENHPVETRQCLYQLAKDLQFRVREGVALGSIALLQRNFNDTWSWLSSWYEDLDPEVRQTLAMILTPFVQEDQLPPHAQLVIEKLRLDSHKKVVMITRHWNETDRVQ